jgi:hypothetical protein
MLQTNKANKRYKTNKQGVNHMMALPFTLKCILLQKRRLMETQIFHNAKT